jgi:hypothetical protein
MSNVPIRVVALAVAAALSTRCTIVVEGDQLPAEQAEGNPQRDAAVAMMARSSSAPSRTRASSVSAETQPAMLSLGTFVIARSL